MMAEIKRSMKVGSRKSQLALIQTKFIIGEVKKLFPEYSFEIVTLDTLGDKVLDKALPKIGEKALFTKELEDALLDG
ncbi:porphobilinogen deaminase, partial [Paramuricea clavata]